MKIPSELKYASTDEWVKVEGNIATVGVSDFAQSQLSDIVYLEFKVEVDEVVTQGQPVVTIESVKAAADANSPISGKVVELNEELNSSFESINTDPYGAAWMVKIEISDSQELDGLMDAETYAKYCEGRGH